MRGYGFIGGLRLPVTAALLGLAVALSCDRDKPKPATAPSNVPSSAPSTAPTSSTAPLAPTTRLIDAVRDADRAFPTTEPLVIPGTLDNASRLVVTAPVHLDSRMDLWVTNARAHETADVLARASDEQTHVLRERVVFVHWLSTSTSQSVAVLVRGEGESFELVTPKSRVPLARESYDWDRAITFEQFIVVPTDRGVCVINATGRAEKFEWTGTDDKLKPQLLLEVNGILAWIPWDNGLTGSKGAARYTAGKWTKLDSSSNWPERILHLVPLRDGSVLQLVIAADKSVTLQLDAAEGSEGPGVDAGRIAALVEKMSDADPKIRKDAFTELGQFGPGAFPILDKLKSDQPPAVQSRIDELLDAKLSPRVGTMRLEPGEVRVASRMNDGGVVLYCPAGIALPKDEAGADETIVAPAWLALRPAYSPQVLPEKLVEELEVGKQKITAFLDEWIVTDAANGPRRFMGNHFATLLKKRERTKFTEFVGVDRRARWLYRNPADGSTLIVDPTLPDPTPRLPVWEYPVSKGTVGWTSDNWPAIKNVGVWVLTGNDDGWRPLDEKTEKFLTELPEIVVPTQPATTRASTTQASEPPILIEADGTRFFGGLTALRKIGTDGTEQTWELPPTAIGDSDYIRLFRAGNDRLFLFNRAGRVLRIAETAAGTEPFQLEATFTKGIPNTDTPARIWLDPAGRIIIAHGSELAILFPSGQIPPRIAEKMTRRGDRDDE